MSAFDEVVIDEVRFPRMFGSMRRAGMYGRCGCAGCPPCRNAAQRLLRGIARSPQASAPYRPDQWGNRYRTLSRRIGRRKVSVLADMDGAAPTVVDVAVGDSDAPSFDDARVDMDADGAGAGSAPIDADAHASADAGGDDSQGELSLSKLISDGVPDASTAIGSTAKLRKLVAEIPRTRFPKFTLVENTDASDAPDTPGLYLIQWPGGQYLGKSNQLRSRIRQHLAALQRYRVTRSLYKFYFAKVSGNVRQVEKQILTELVKTAGSGDEQIEKKFFLLGMTNKQREFEFL